MGSCYDKPKKEPADCTPEEEGNPTLAHRMQVGNANAMKWKSDAGEGDHIPVIHKKGQYWRVENRSNDSLWSFYIMSGTDRLYVSYNGSDPNDQNVTLEPTNDGDSSKERYFRARLYPSGRLRLHPEKKTEKVIGIENGVLALVDPEGRPEEEIGWVIDFEVKKGYVQGDCFITLQRAFHDQFAMHAVNGDEIPVGTSPVTANYEWEYQTQPEGINTFRVPIRKGPYIAKESDEKGTTGVIMNDNPSSSKLKEFKLVKIDQIRGDCFQSVADETQYLGISSNQKLQLVPKEQAVGWTHGLEIIRMIFMFGEQEVVFPPLPNDFVDQK